MSPKGLSVKDLKVIYAKNLSSYDQRIQDMVKGLKLWSSIQSHGPVSKVMVEESKVMVNDSVFYPRPNQSIQYNSNQYGVASSQYVRGCNAHNQLTNQYNIQYPISNIKSINQSINQI